MTKKTKTIQDATKAADDTGAMIALYIPSDIGQRLALPGGEPIQELHLTLCYLGDMDDLENPERLKQFVAEFAATHYLQPARIGGIGRFNRISESGTQAVYATVDSPNLPNFRQELVSGAEWSADVEPSRDYGFVPHVTLAYVPVDAPMPLQNIEPLEFSFKQISLTIGPERWDYDLVTEAKYINTGRNRFYDVYPTRKAGARHSMGDMKALQDIHDRACELGAKCADPSNVVYTEAGKAADPDDYLVVEDKDKVSTYHLQVKENGKPNHRLMGAAWAALHSGYRGNVYEGPNKAEAITKLKKLYEAEEMTPPGEDKQKAANDPLEGASVDTNPSNHSGSSPSPATLSTPSNALKAISTTNDQLTLGNYMILFNGRDLEGIMSANKNADGSVGEYFTPNTQFESDYTAIGRLPVDWEHGRGYDGLDKHDKLGYVDWATAKADNTGLWVQRVLNRRNRYVQMLEPLIKAGLIGTSSEAIPEKVVKAANGEITAWPLMGDALTVNPMDYRMLDGNTLQALKALALEVPAVKSACQKLGIDTNQGQREATRLRLKAKRVLVLGDKHYG